MLLVFTFARLGVSERNLIIGHQVGVSSTKATARHPDLIVHSDQSRAAIFDDGKILRAGVSAPLLVVEVVSNSLKDDKKSYKRDYEEKPLEYAERGIPEMWLIDPDRAIVKVGTLTDGVYEFQDFTGKQVIQSPTFTSLTLTAIEVLTAGE
jgi:Uma2 family endonuclease